MTYVQKNYYTSAKTTLGYDGTYYASMFEASYANELFARKGLKEIESYDTQVRMPCIVNGYKVCDYIADFVIYHLDGSNEIVETKGFKTPVFNLKWKLVEALYEKDYKITLLMQNDKMTKSKTGGWKSWKPKVIEF
jgi:Protein of unknown function (DUF1064)